MLAENDINPKNDIYFWGAKIISVLESNNKIEFDILEIFEILNNKESEKISFNLYLLSLDWLYLINVIDNTKDKIKKCF